MDKASPATLDARQNWLCQYPARCFLDDTWVEQSAFRIRDDNKRNLLTEENAGAMTFNETKLPGVFEVHPEPITDERGFFARVWCRKEFENNGLSPEIAQCSISFNVQKGTLRGLHYQKRPYEEIKLVRCTRGSIYDVVIDLRPHSPTFRTWVSAVLTAENRTMLYIPVGCAHGFLTLDAQVEVFYQISEFYMSEFACGVRWNDPAFGIDWPAPISVISERDRTYPDFQDNNEPVGGIR